MVFSKPILQGDEGRYLVFSENLLNGFYAKPNLKPGFLWNGPGYPIIISPFKALDVPLICYKILNIFFVFLSIFPLYIVLKNFLNKRVSLVISSLIPLSHPYIFDSLTRILTESLAFFLINVFFLLMFKFEKTNKIKFLLINIPVSGLLILTKVFFSYVFLFLTLIFLVHSFYNKKRISYLFFFSSPFLFCLPYLFYTFSITNKIFYWSDAGGSSLYSMSTPYEDEFGDWFSPVLDENNRVRYSAKGSRTTIPKLNPPFYQRHNLFLSSISKMNGLEKDAELKKEAIKNIIENPYKYSKNVLYNISRIFLREPFTDRKLKPFFKLIFYSHGIILLVGYLFSLLSTFITRNNFFIKLSTIFVLITLSLTSLLSAESRFLFPFYGIFLSLIIIQIKNFRS